MKDPDVEIWPFTAARRDGNRMRAAAQTIDAADMRCIWSESFDRDMTDIFDLQEEIVLRTPLPAADLGEG